MTRRRSTLAWGLVGGLSFLVLVQGYELLMGVRVGATVKVGVAAVVAAGAAALVHVVGQRFAPPNGSA